MSLLKRIEKSLDQRLRSIFAGDAVSGREAIELYRDALDQIAARATAGKRGDRIFPFNLITVELRAPDAERKAVLETLFDLGHLGEDIRATLTEERITLPPDLTVAIRYPEEAAAEMRILCERAGKPAQGSTPGPEVPSVMKPARLLTVTGVSSASELGLDRSRINLGREQEVVDALGRPIRRNELFFPDGSHDANASVSRSHAHIQFDSASGDWRIFDDGSSIGTSLFREGRRIEVPAHASRGVTLRAGDEIYLGQVRLRFETDAAR